MSPPEIPETRTVPPAPLAATPLDVSDFAELRTAVAPAKGAVLTIGNFDGLHAGHQAIIANVSSIARDLSTSTAAITFEPHPVRHFRPDAPPFRLTTAPQKTLLLRHYGIDWPTVLAFGQDLADVEPEAFIREVLIGGFEPARIVVGYDFNFGKDRRGTPELLCEVCAAEGYDVEVQSAIDVGDEVVSSTRVRKRLRAGDMSAVRRALGRPYALVGRVVHGEGRGRVLGFPTANIAPENALLPPNGVYATYLEVGGGRPRRYASITNIGIRPTFDEGVQTIEAFVLDDEDVDLDLYGEPVALHVLEFLREERKFPSPRDLVAQIHKDIERCRQILAADAAPDVVAQADAASFIELEGSFADVRGNRDDG